MKTIQRPGRGLSPFIKIFLIIDAILVTCFVLWIMYQKGYFVDRNAVLNEKLSKSELAIAHLENQSYSKAQSLFQDVLKLTPEDPSTNLNLAIVNLGLVEDAKAKINDAKTPAEERTKIQADLPGMISTAEESAKLASTLSPDSIEPKLLILRARRERLPLLQYPLDVEVKIEMANDLLTWLKQFPGNPTFAVELSDLAEELQDDRPELQKESLEATYEAWKKSPRNLLLLQQAGRGFALARDPRVTELLEASRDIVAPVRAEIQIQNAGRDPLPELEEALQKVKTGDLASAAPPAIRWFSLLVGNSAFRSDLDRIKPNLLALISFEGVTLWRSELSKTRAQAAKATTIDIAERNLPPLPGSDPVRNAVWYDFDLDLKSEIAWLQGNQLHIAAAPEEGASEWKIISSIDVNPNARSIVVADLFGIVLVDQPKIVADLARSRILPQVNDDKEAASVIADRRNDTFQELIVISTDGIEVISSKVSPSSPQERQLSKIERPTGLESLSSVELIKPIDWDADGDLDLAIVANQALQLWQNNGNRTFTSYSSFSELPGNDVHIKAISICDYDRDVDLDIVVACSDTDKFGVVENLTHGQFRWLPLQEGWQALGEASSVAFGELDGNASWDWLVGTAKGVRIVTTSTPDSGIVVANQVRFMQHAPARGIDVADLNNDGWLDVIHWGESVAAIFAGLGNGTIEPNGLNFLATPDIQSLEVCDFNLDGRQDILALAGNKIRLLVGKAAAPAADSNSNYTSVRLKGIDDGNGGGRVNQYGIGSTIEIWAGDRYFAEVVKTPSTHFGLGQIKNPESIRIIFPNGLTQSVVSPPINSTLEEKQIPKGSCPFVYGWDGEKFVLITDLLWNAPLGLQFEKGKTLPDRRWEYLFLPGEQVQPQGNVVELRVTEELWEAAYFDQVELIAVDHPADTRLFTNEKVGPPDIAAHQLYTTTKPKLPIRASDSQGKDWLKAVSAKDRQYAQPFDTIHCQGLTKEHFIELDFGDLQGAKSIQLILTGWLYPTDTSLNIGLDQHPDLAFPQPPSLWVPNAQGEFECVNPFIGFPGGKPKSIVVDLTNRFLTNDYRIRIATTAQIYWDEAILRVDESNTELIETPLVLESADLHYRGFSAATARAPDQPHWFDYAQVDLLPNWPPLEGTFTRYGDVRELLGGDDNRMVVMGSGDEMSLRFRVPKKAVPPGWKRDYVMHNVGWDKDADLNTLEGQSSLPLPFKEMKQYPPTVEQSAEAAEVERLNRDQLTRRANFRQFWHGRERTR